MDHVCLALPLLPGKAPDARTLFRQLDGARRAEFDRSERRIGISRVLWFLARLPAGAHVVVYIEAAEFNRALQMFVNSRDAFDMWFKEQMLAVTRLDLNNPPADMRPAELLSHYEAGAVTT